MSSADRLDLLLQLRQITVCRAQLGPEISSSSPVPSTVRSSHGVLLLLAVLPAISSLLLSVASLLSVAALLTPVASTLASVAWWLLVVLVVVASRSSGKVLLGVWVFSARLTVHGVGRGWVRVLRGLRIATGSISIHSESEEQNGEHDRWSVGDGGARVDKNVPVLLVLLGSQHRQQISTLVQLTTPANLFRAMLTDV